MSTVIDEFTPDFAHVIEFFRSELNGLRTGRANAAMVEDIPVEAYGSKMEIKGLASIAVPDSKTIMIDPWDKGLVKDIEKAIRISPLGVSPTVDGAGIRISLPPMTEEGRKDLVKVVKKKAEDALVSVRAIREKMRDRVQQLEKDKEISEDDRFRLQDAIETRIKEQNEKIRKMAEEKEEEVMKI